MNLKRILTYLLKDIKENYIVVLIMLLVPVIAFILPKLNQLTPTSICVINYENNDTYIQSLKKHNFKVIYKDKEDEAIKLLNKGKAMAYIDFKELSVKTNSKDVKILSNLKEALNFNNSELISIENRGVSEISFNVLLCIILFVLISLLACPIVFLSDRKNDIYTYLMITPLTNFEYVISKICFSIFSMLFSIVFYLVVICQSKVDISYLLLVTGELAILAAFVSAIVTMFFDSIENYILIAFPILLLAVVMLVIAYGNNALNKLALYDILFSLLINNKINFIDFGIIGCATIVLAYIYIHFWKRISRTY